MLEPSKLPAAVTPQCSIGAGASSPSSARHLVERPHVELALHALGVGVLGRVEAAVGVAQVAQHVGDGLVEDLPEARLAGDLPGMEVAAAEQRLVVERRQLVLRRPLLVEFLLLYVPQVREALERAR